MSFKNTIFILFVAVLLTLSIKKTKGEVSLELEVAEEAKKPLSDCDLEKERKKLRISIFTGCPETDELLVEKTILSLKKESKCTF